MWDSLKKERKRAKEFQDKKEKSAWELGITINLFSSLDIYRFI